MAVFNTGTFLTNDEITKATTVLLQNEMKFINLLDDESSYFGDKAHQQGLSQRIRKPIQTTTNRNGDANVVANWTFSGQTLSEDSVTLTLDTVIGRDITLTALEMQYKIEDFSKIVLLPTITGMAQDAESIIYQKVMAQSQVSAVGASLTYDTLVDLSVSQDELLASHERYLAISPKMAGTVRKDIKSLTQASSTLAESFTKGVLGNIAGYETYTSTLLPKFVTQAGADRAGALAADAVSGTATLSVNAFQATLVIKAGDVLELTGIYEVNAATKVATSVLKQYIVAADITLDGAGAGVISVTEAPVWAGAKQNVSAKPVSTTVISLKGAAAGTSYECGLSYCSGAVGIAFGNLEGSNVGDNSRPSAKGVRANAITWYDNAARVWNLRIDMLFGVVVKVPQYVRRVAISA